jgi:hypothetical protein
MGELRTLLEQLPDATIVATDQRDAVLLNDRAVALLAAATSNSTSIPAAEWLTLDSITEILLLVEAGGSSRRASTSSPSRSHPIDSSRRSSRF